MKKEIKKFADLEIKDELAEKLLTVQRDLDCYKNYCKDYDRYCSAMIAAAHNGDMPICIDPLNNIQYAEIYSKESIKIIKRILYENKVLHNILLINTIIMSTSIIAVIWLLVH